MPQSFQRRFLKKREATQLLLSISKKLKTSPKELFGTKTRVESTEIQDGKIFFINSMPLLVSYKDTLFPTLLFSEALNRLPKITVNMGAVPYICNGADVMAPGVVQIEGQFQTDEFLLVVDERHHKPLAVGKALYNSEDMKNLKQGKIVENIHYVGDKHWNFLKQL